MRLGLLGGSFDPIHNGHLLLANEVLEAYKLDCINFIPAYKSPHKSTYPKADEYSRIKMLNLALKENKHFQLNTLELERKGISYTIDTVEELYKRYEDKLLTKLHLIIGVDLLKKLRTWMRFEELEEKVKFIVALKGLVGEDIELEEALKKYKDIDKINNTQFKISSTLIRAKVLEGKSIKYLVPKAVEEYIRSNNLYKAAKKE